MHPRPRPLPRGEGAARALGALPGPPPHRAFGKQACSTGCLTSPAAHRSTRPRSTGTRTTRRRSSTGTRTRRRLSTATLTTRRRSMATPTPPRSTGTPTTRRRSTATPTAGLHAPRLTVSGPMPWSLVRAAGLKLGPAAFQATRTGRARRATAGLTRGRKTERRSMLRSWSRPKLGARMLSASLALSRSPSRRAVCS